MYDDIQRAIENNDVKHLKEVLRFYKNDEVSEYKASSLMWLSIKDDYDEILEVLLEDRPSQFSANAYVNTECDHYASHDVPLLIIAISYDAIGCARILVEHGAHIDASSSCLSPLGYALLQGKRDIAHYLLLKKAQLNDIDIQLLNKFSMCLLDMGDIINFFEDTQKIKEEFSTALSKRISSHTKKGAQPKDSRVKIREYHSFNKERERQILRHVATQLYFSLKPKYEKLVEIQAMHLICGDKSNLFIAANEFCVAKNFKKIKDDFQEKLITAYSPRTTEEKERSRRYAEKLKKRVFGKKQLQGKSRDLERANVLKNIISKKEINFITLDYSGTPATLSKQSEKELKYLFGQKDDQIFFILIKDCSYKKRHSEEFLCDIVAVAKDKFVGLDNIESSIAGKKRPCLGCKGRMDHEKITTYARYPGLFFKHTAKYQPAGVAKETFDNFNGTIYLSDVCSKSKQLPVSDFDSGSTSEETSSNSLG